MILWLDDVFMTLSSLPSYIHSYIHTYIHTHDQAEVQAQQSAIEMASAQIRSIQEASAGPAFNDQFSTLEKRVLRLQR